MCTGNAARSVMAQFMLEHWAVALGRPLEVVSAGTHVAEGQPMSMRTRAAIASIGALSDVTVGVHRSKQLRQEDLSWADLVVTMEADHVRYVRRRHPEAAARTGTLRRLCLDLAGGDDPLSQRVDAVGLAKVDLGVGEDVTDPAGGDTDVYVACAQELWGLTEDLARLL